jgi:hypothetical protein
MRRPIATTVPVTLAVLAVACVAAPARAQDSDLQTKFWPRSDISFPIDLAEFERLDPRPASIRFYAAPPNGRFKLIANKRPNELDKIIDKQDPSATPRRGFTYVAAADGVEEFAVQYEYDGGRLAPKSPTPQFRIHFDTKLPEVRATASGTNGIRWEATDANLVPSSIRIEGQYAGETQWQLLNTGELKADDSFRWNTIPANKTLEVRVSARDRAGNNGYSRIIRLGSKADRADPDFNKKPGVGSFGDPITKAGGGSGRTGSGFGGLDEFPSGQAKIEYRSTNKLNVKSKVTHITRSGVKAAQLFVQSGTTDWVPAGKKEGLNFTLDTPDPVVEIPYDAPRDGLYGFIIQPISGAGTKADDPRPGDAPQFLVEVDTVKPEITIKNIRVGGGGLNGPLVEVEWHSFDKNEMPEPITLEYSDDDKKTWKPITAKTQNTGKYTWEITDKKLWRFHVRASAVDKAGNNNFDVTKEPVLVDLDKPAGTVDQVNPNGEASFRKQVNLNDDRFQPAASTPPATLTVKPASAAPTETKPAAPLPIGGRIGAPPVSNLPEPKKEDEKPKEPKKIDADVPPVDISKPIDLPPIKSDPTPPAPAGGTTAIPIPELPPIVPPPAEKK